MKKSLIIFILFTMCLSIVTGCGNSSSNSPQSQHAFRSINQELVVAIGSEPEAGYASPM